MFFSSVSVVAGLFLQQIDSIFIDGQNKDSVLTASKSINSLQFTSSVNSVSNHDIQLNINLAIQIRRRTNPFKI